jgi:methyl-accepting chemotaxis protein
VSLQTEQDTADDGVQPQSAQRTFQGLVCLDALPLWAGQVETARVQAEEAVVSLSERFSGIVDRLDAALGSSREDMSSDQISRDAEEGARRLGQVMESLRAIQNGRDTLVQAIRGLVTYTDELQAMSSEVEKVAFSTNILAVNAAIEAAHAGESGRGFAVVAQEIRALSVAARETGKRISERVGLINATLEQTGAQNERIAREDKEAVDSSAEHIGSVLERFRARTQRLSDLAQQSSRESEAIKGEVAQSLVQLQFQDRMSQILAHVVKNMTELRQAEPDGDGNAHGYLDRMKQTYTTHEQRQLHEGGKAQVAVPQDVTFF